MIALTFEIDWQEYCSQDDDISEVRAPEPEPSEPCPAIANTRELQQTRVS